MRSQRRDYKRVGIAVRVFYEAAVKGEQRQYKAAAPNRGFSCNVASRVVPRGCWCLSNGREVKDGGGIAWAAGGAEGRRSEDTVLQVALQRADEGSSGLYLTGVTTGQLTNGTYQGAEGRVAACCWPLGE